MATSAVIERWHVLEKSVTGASHLRDGHQQNQDAFAHFPEALDGMPFVVAIADGHGNPKSFRSHVGSSFAVHEATQVLWRALQERPGQLTEKWLKRQAMEEWPRLLVEAWGRRVEQDLADHPIRRAELDYVARKSGEQARAQIQRYPILAYGSTLLVAVITEVGITYLQLGDGDILTVSDDWRVMRPMSLDERLIANETTSLAGEKAWYDFRVHFEDGTSGQPALIVLSTDGYANSFANEDEFLKVGVDYLGLLTERGVDGVQKNLRHWLQETSDAGSGDDTTLCLVYREAERAPRPVELQPEAAELVVQPAPVSPVSSETTAAPTEHVSERGLAGMEAASQQLLPSASTDTPCEARSSALPATAPAATSEQALPEVTASEPTPDPAQDAPVTDKPREAAAQADMIQPASDVEPVALAVTAEPSSDGRVSLPSPGAIAAGAPVVETHGTEATAAQAAPTLPQIPVEELPANTASGHAQSETPA